MNKIFTIVLLSFFLPTAVFAVACPLGKTNEPAPGTCGLYRDANKDGYCDLSESAESINYSNKLFGTEDTLDSKVTNNVGPKDHKIGLVTIVLFFGYLIGLLAVKNKKISFIAHRRFWNWFLLVLFIPTAITSFFLALVIEFGIVINFGLDLSFWHFVFGWAFLLVSLFHVIWHTSYYFRRNNKNCAI